MAHRLPPGISSADELVWDRQPDKGRHAVWIVTSRADGRVFWGMSTTADFDRDVSDWHSAKSYGDALIEIRSAAVRGARRELHAGAEGKDYQEVLRRTQQAYRILLTRAMKGAVVWFEDPETKRHVLDELGVHSGMA